MRTRLTLFVVSFLLIGCGREARTGLVACEAPADATIERACRIATVAPVVATIWPGYWPTTQAFLLTDSETQSKTLYWPNESVPEGYALVDDTLPPVLAGRLYHAVGFDPMLTMLRGFSPAAEVEGVMLPAMPTRLFTDDTLHSFAFLYHEFFHAYQEGAFDTATAVTSNNAFGVGTGMGERALDPALSADSAFLNGVEVERRLLARALQAPRGAGRDSVVAEYLSARRSRIAGNPAVTYLEDRMETSEGTATYVGYRAALAALGRDDSELAGLITERWLAPPLDSFPEGPEVDAKLTRWRHYGTGAAMCILLEEAGIDWRTPVARGESTLVELMESAHERD